MLKKASSACAAHLNSLASQHISTCFTAHLTWLRCTAHLNKALLHNTAHMPRSAFQQRAALLCAPWLCTARRCAQPCSEQPCAASLLRARRVVRTWRKVSPKSDFRGLGTSTFLQRLCRRPCLQMRRHRTKYVCAISGATAVV